MGTPPVGDLDTDRAKTPCFYLNINDLLNFVICNWIAVFLKLLRDSVEYIASNLIEMVLIGVAEALRACLFLSFHHRINILVQPYKTLKIAGQCILYITITVCFLIRKCKNKIFCFINMLHVEDAMKPKPQDCHIYIILFCCEIVSMFQSWLLCKAKKISGFHPAISFSSIETFENYHTIMYAD